MTVPAQNLTSHISKVGLTFRRKDDSKLHKWAGYGDESSSPGSSALVEYLFSSVASPTLASGLPTLRDDVEALKKAIELLIEATEDGTLTETETDTMLRLLAVGFTTRRFNQLFERISNIDEANWFIAASRMSNHE